MKTIVIVAWLLLSACTATDPRLTVDYYDGYDDGPHHYEDYSDCMRETMDNAECFKLTVWNT